MRLLTTCPARAWVAGLLLVSACAAPYRGTKDGLTPYPGVAAEELDAAHEARRIALLIGVNQFDDTAWRPLRYAVRDAREVGAALLDPKVGAFDQVDVHTQAEDTDRLGLMRAFDDLDAKVQDTRDTVVVYLSTHGTLARDSRGDLRAYLVARDTTMADVPGSGISMDAIRARFARLKSRRKVLVLATCHSGQGKSALPSDIARELSGLKGGGFFVPPIDRISEAAIVITACSWGETAREDETLQHDVYTHYLLESLLRRLDPNGDGAVTVSEAHDHAMRKTYGFTSGRQRPTAQSDILGQDPIVLVGRRVRPGRPALVGYGDQWRRVRVLVDGTDKGGLPGSVLIEPGEHDLELIRDGAQEPFASASIDLSPGERLELWTLLDTGESGTEIGVTVGGQSFLAGDARAEVFAPGPLVRLEGTVSDAIAPGWALAGDVGFGQHRARLRPGGVALDALHETVVGGLGVYRDVGWGRVRLRTGPRLEVLSLSRSLTGPDGFRDQEGIFSMGVGLAAGIGVPIGGGFSAVFDVRLSLIYLRVDDEALNLTNGAAFGGLRYGL